MGLAAAGLAEQQDRGGPAAHEAEGGEVVDEGAVDGGLEVEVELLDGAPGGNRANRSRAARRRWRVAVASSATSAARNSSGPRGASPLGEGGEHLGGAVQLEIAEVVFDLLDRAWWCSSEAPAARARCIGS